MSKAVIPAVERDSDTEPDALTAFYVDPVLLEQAIHTAKEQARIFDAGLHGDFSEVMKLPDWKREFLAWTIATHEPARHHTFPDRGYPVILGDPEAPPTVEELEEMFATEPVEVAPEPAPAAPNTLFMKASSVAPRRQTWLPGMWHGRIPVALPTLLVGMQGKGKSQVTCRLAADVTAGGGTVLILSAEDDPATTIVPRLMAAGADLDRVHIHRIEEPLKFPRDIGRLDEFVTASAATLIIVDPVLAYLDRGSDAYRPQDVREVLSALHAMCQKHGTTILGLMHFRKESTAEVLHMVTSSSAFTEGARSVLGLGSQPEADGLALVHLKCNVGKEMPTLALTIEDVGGIADADGRPIETSRIAVGGQLDLKAEDVFQPSKGGRKPDKREEAEDFLRVELRRSLPERRVAVAAMKKLWRDSGLGSENTLMRARDTLGLLTLVEDRTWYWAAPATWELEPLPQPKALPRPKKKPRAKKLRAKSPE